MNFSSDPERIVRKANILSALIQTEHRARHPLRGCPGFFIFPLIWASSQRLKIKNQVHLSMNLVPFVTSKGEKSNQLYESIEMVEQAKQQLKFDLKFPLIISA